MKKKATQHLKNSSPIGCSNHREMYIYKNRYRARVTLPFFYIFLKFPVSNIISAFTPVDAVAAAIRGFERSGFVS